LISRNVLAQACSTSMAAGKRRYEPDFALRGFVACGCGTLLTAGWSKGRSKHYPYYFCYNLRVLWQRAKRGALEGDFERLLAEVKPFESVFKAARHMLEAAWNARVAANDARLNALRDTREECRSTRRAIARSRRRDGPKCRS
jgi:hypothetical protein